ncbi:Fic family protein [Candidatus Woesearchaeota archaeon]|nr:Fic family protein [Candidatus Woesearchaeota archaeon]
MVTKYDVFEYVYGKGTPVKPLEIVRNFKKSHADYQVIYKMLLSLSEKGFVEKSKYGFQALRSKKNDLTFNIIRFCVSNQINYNELLDEKLALFISKAFLKKRFGIGNFHIDSRRFMKYVNILSKYGLLIILSRKPLEATIPYNSFLRDLVAYFGYKVLVAQPKKDEYFDDIERELKKLKRVSRKDERKYQAITEEFEIRFIHHSLSLEGNPITLPDTIKLLKKHIVPRDIDLESVHEVQNYQKAIQKMAEDSLVKSQLTKAAILNYHFLAMQHKPDMAGRIRDKGVHIRGNPDFKVAKIDEIEPKLAVLLDKYNGFTSKKKSLKQILEFAAHFHNEFQHIHPFEDGNSRTTRLITFHLLRTQDIPILDIPLGLLEEYVFSTKGSKKREDKKLNQVLQRIILYNLKTINEKLQ